MYALYFIVIVFSRFKF